MTTPTGTTVPATYWKMEVGGWMYLLPPLAERRVLCISSMRDSADQATMYGELTLLHDSQVEGLPSEQDLANCGVPGLCWRSVDSLVGATVAESAHQQFDGLVIHDPAGAIVHQGNLQRLLQLLRQIPRWLRPAAFVYLGVPNPRSLPRIIASAMGQRGPHERRPVSIATLQEALRSGGLTDIRIHPYLMWGPRLAEVIPPRGYRAGKHRERLAERAKEFVYGRIGSRNSAPAFAILARTGPTAPSVLDMIIAQATAACNFQGPVAPVVKNYLLFPGTKAIVTIGPSDRENDDVVAVISSDALAIERRSVEVAVLSELAKLPPRLAQALPRPLGQIAVGKTRCYLLSRMPGVTLDLDSEALGQVTDQALEFVIDLHRTSSQQVRIDESSYRALFWSLIEAAQTRLPSLAAELQTWDAPLRACVMGAVLPSVWMHGDYKIENVMYDDKLRKLTGVIDWEHARLPGLPLLDPLYLLIYNRQIRGEEHFQSIESVLSPGRRSDVERAQLDRYVESVGIAAQLAPALCAMFVAHHVGCRLHFRPDGGSLDRVRGVIRQARDMLERPTARFGPPRHELDQVPTARAPQSLSA